MASGTAMEAFENKVWSADGFVDPESVLRSGPWKNSDRREGYPLYHWMRKGFRKKMPLSLERLCIQKSIDCVNDLRDVADIRCRYLRIILPHCTAEQLLRVEKETKDRDLAPITNKMWKKLYAENFGVENASLVSKRMASASKTFRWRSLYQVKLKQEADMKQVSKEQ